MTNSSPPSRQASASGAARHRRFEAAGDLDEQPVAGRVAERVVHVLEAVEIEDRDRSLPVCVLQQAVERLRHRQAVGEPGELIEMRELAQLLLGLLAGGDVLVHKGDAAQDAVLGVERRRREAHVDEGSVLANSSGLEAADDLAAAGAAIDCVPRIRHVRRDDLGVLTEDLRFGVAVDVLGRAIPYEQLAIDIRAGDRDRRCVDHGVERVLRLAQFVGVLEPRVAAALQRRGHPIEGLRQLAEFAGRGDRSAVAQFSRGQDRGIALQLAQRANDAARQHPSDERSDGDGEEPEQSAQFELGGDWNGTHLHRQADDHQPWRAVRGRIASEAGDSVVPGRKLAALPGAQTPPRIGGLREVAARPIGDVGDRRNRDPSFVEDADDAAGRKLVRPYCPAEALDRSSDDQHRLQFACRIPDGVRNGKDPTAAHPAAQGIADRDQIARHDPAEKGEGADAVSLP